MKISNDMKRKFDLINVLSRSEKPSLHDLHQATKIPESTIKRQLSAIRSEFGMKVLFIRDTGGERGATGYYILTDWGIIDRDAFFKHYMML
ncbi:helix-turn-helix domain-containing protein [Marinobacterium aestuariivivens]|uniref:Helix-turn-helix domain-containing protein n=1 Tax=Marinobacterium aestuariivivens TaxID=1698799 RepID=A0ABW2A9E4_9GAMM